MATQLNIVSDEKTKRLITPDHINNFSFGNNNNLDKSKNGLALKISSALQSTLEIEPLIKLFSQQIKPAIPHEGFTYHNDPLGLALHFGKKCKNQCQYNLLVDNESLGELSLHRRWGFSREDKKIFEYTLCGMVYPLRNAILYNQALQAANKDALTGVYNRSTLEVTLNREVKLAKRYKRSLSLVILDIDDFKSYNDNYGHNLGDEVIKFVADKTLSSVRTTDIIFRYGGEEFVILLSNTDIHGGKQLAERIRDSIAGTGIPFEDQSLKVTVSLGVAELEEDEMNVSFFSRADQALYKAKAEGKNCVCAEINSVTT